MNRLHFVLLLLGISLCVPCAAAGYRWKDADGNTIFSQFPPPPGMQADRIKLKPVPGGAPPPANNSVAATVDAEKPASKPQAAPREPTPEELAKIAALKRQNCAAAQKNLSIYLLPNNRKYIDKDGNYQRIDENERQRRIAETRQRISENCE